jgi:2-keto-4-pentenoate hydratase
MTAFDPAPAAAALDAARAARTKIAPLGAAAPRDVAEGAAVQRARAGTGSPGGFKIGATARRMQEYLGLDGPAAGYMRAADLHGSGATLRFADFVAPGVECELAVRLARDLPPGPCALEQAIDAAGEVTAAIEIVENRYGDLAALGTPTLIADQVFHAAAVVGEPGAASWRTLDLPALAGTIRVDGEERGTGLGADLLGHPLRSLAWLAASPVAAAFGGLRAGQLIMLGSVTPPIWLDRPGRVTVAFPPLPEVVLTLL